MSSFRVASLYKNQIATPSKKDGWQAELPIGNTTDHSHGIATSRSHLYVKSSVQGELIKLPLDAAGKKYGHAAPSISLGGAIVDFAISSFEEEVLAVAYEDSKIATSPLSDPSNAQTWTSPHPVQSISFHPHVNGLLLVVSPQQISILNQSSVVRSIPSGPKQFWDACWTQDGQNIVTSSKDGVVSLFDARSDAEPIRVSNHNGIKPIKLASVGNLVFSTGFSKTRDREYSVYDQRNFGKPLRTQRIDTNTGTLHPLVDRARNIVYLVGKGDMQLRWTEISPSHTFAEGGSPLPVPILGAALAPPSVLDVMKTEINRIYVSSKEGVVVPVPLSVPRRQYLDFHSDLYPELDGLQPGCTAEEWVNGSNATRSTVDVTESGPAYSQSNPSAVAKKDSPIEESVTKMGLNASPAPEKTSTPEEKPQSEAKVCQPKPFSSVVPLKSPPMQASATSSESAPATSATASTSSQAPAIAKLYSPAKAASAKKTNTHYSRQFLIGKTPLRPEFEGLSGLATVTPPEMLLLKANPSILVFPLAGAGGRLACHSMSKKGRFAPRFPALVTGASITAFELDPFRPFRVFAACDDSKIRVFDVPTEGLNQDHGDTVRMLSDAKMDRITELVAHPTADGLLLSVSEDRGNPSLRMWDTPSGSVLHTVPIDCSGIFTARWSPDGSRLAIVCKNKKLLVLDPRNPSETFSCFTHDSPKLVRVTWLDSQHLLTTGFSRSATRECILYSAVSNEVKIISRNLLDVSPAPLFPFFDADTSILYLYAKGERSCLPFEMKLDQAQDNFAKLPTFGHDTLQLGLAFLPKRYVDTNKVEVSIVLRLTAVTIERVAFSIPRARLEFFQDDVYVPTADVETASLSAEGWSRGENAESALLDLNTSSLPPLSEAPPTQAQASTRAKIAAGPQLTDSQKSQQYMDRLYAKAQADADESDEEPKPSQVPDDDDW